MTVNDAVPPSEAELDEWQQRAIDAERSGGYSLALTNEVVLRLIVEVRRRATLDQVLKAIDDAYGGEYPDKDIPAEQFHTLMHRKIRALFSERHVE